MVFDEFEKKLLDAGIIYSGQDIITKDWTTGGQCGGSCWGCSPEDYRPRSVEPEPEMEELDKILELVYPSIGFLQYKALVKELVTVTEGTSSDYYGNDEEYSRKRLSLEELYNYLVEKGWIDGH